MPDVSARNPSSERRNYLADEFCLKMPDFHVTFRDLLHAVNLRHGANGFTSLPKEGVLRTFSPWKNPRLRPGLNLRTWVPKASRLPLNHRSRSHYYIVLVHWFTFVTTTCLWTGIAQSVMRLTTSWKVRDRIPVRARFFHTRPERPWCPASLLYNGDRVFFRVVKRPGCGLDHSPTPHPVHQKCITLFQSNIRFA